ncbi:YdcF family protein [Pseudomonas viridiflava]|uniref:YdcF family protein n=1 Tax=Pseudomonas viridiflava TaxID=33069 RepID=UPI000F03E929|nr:YdcF family protein [Pseudomonas viridiflava]MDY0917724.1 YdcF family protein [Pseudomonas viridiflava]MEE4223561.1 YdcF family protein [Pseudomonas viridiflava]
MKLLRTLSISLPMLLMLFAGAIVIDGLSDTAKTSDAAIVLGSQVLPDGTPSDRLRARLDRAEELYRQGLVRHIIVSGGTGKEGFSEAAVMADYLVEHGKIAHEAILLDEQGNTTRDTAINGAGIMKGKGFTSAVVVTQYFHITRSQYALKQAGVMQVSTAHARYFEWRDLYSIAREVVALPAYWWAAST